MKKLDFLNIVMHLKKYFKNLFLIVIIFLFYSTNLVADIDCQSLYIKENKISNIENIEIVFKNKRKWQKKLARILHPRLKSESIKDINENLSDINYEKIVKNKKKRQKAVVKLNYKSGLKCEFKAKIRPHGDLYDHYQYSNGYPISSMNINLEDGNIENITKFILFLPLSRMGDDEILLAILMKYLNILSPRTSYINVKVNGISNRYIFQEKIVKEFLENNSLIEGPIFRAEENFSNYKKYLTNRPALLVNPDWNKAINDYSTSLDLLSNTNNIYLSSKNDMGTKQCSHLILNPNFLTEKEILTFGEFDLIMKAMDAVGGIARGNRRLYYDPINDNYQPIYYDGHVKFSKHGYKKNSYNIDNKEPSCYRYIKIESYSNIIDKLKQLDQNKLKLKLNQAGHKKVSNKYLKNIIDTLIFRINSIRDLALKSSLNLKDYKLPKNYTKYYDQKNYSNDRLIFYNKINENKIIKNEFLECELNLKDCEKVYLEKKSIQKLLRQKYKVNKDRYSETFFISNNLDDYKNEELKRIFFGVSNYNKLKIKNINIIYNDSIEINIEKNNKIIYLKQKNPTGRVIINNSRIDNWKIEFINNKNFKTFKNFLKFDNLSGCLSFIDTKFNNLEIKTYNLGCEDSVNFIRSSGSVKKASITKSAADGIDADFSKIIFRNMSINNAKNDCVDFSYGEYSLLDSNIKNCGDKGVSIGEGSKVIINKAFMENINIGIASKDSSKTIVEDIELKNLNTCFAVYNKKQEFNGSFLQIKNSKCENYQRKTKINSGSLMEFR